MSVQLDERFAEALRASLVTRVRTDARARAPWRRRAFLASVVAVGVAGGGVAVATQLGSAPGADIVTPVSSAISMTGSGNATVDLGVVPAGANRADLELTGLTAGEFVLEDGARLRCTEADAARATPCAMGWSIDVGPGPRTTTVRAAEGARWMLTAQFSALTTQDWGVNASGQTFGVANARGVPDLIATFTDDGRPGYVYSALSGASDPAAEPEPSTPAEALRMQRERERNPRPTTVYDSDGRTVVGVITPPEFTGGVPGG
jgi:hypothetical protein